MTVSDEGSQIRDHLALYRADPDAAHDWNPYGKVVPTLLLTTVGKKTGKLRTRPLIYGQVGDSFVLIASKGGTPEHPAWFTNLMANPDVQVQVRHDIFQAHAREAEGPERDALWAQMVEVLPQYADYQARTERRLPVVVLERLSETG
jgi:deazaflavin-dependent oxidoreductase (nitroreductase family)